MLKKRHNTNLRTNPESIIESKKTNKKKRKIPLFFKLNFSILLICSLFLGYFVVLVSIEPKSIPLIAKKIEQFLEAKIGADVQIAKSEISFTRYGSVKLFVSGLKIAYFASDGKERSFDVPRIEGEFSLLRLVFLSFEPSKIKFINPTITINDFYKFDKSAFVESQSQAQNPIIKILAAIRSGEISTENFEIENAIIIVEGQDFNTEILLKKSKINVDLEASSLVISSKNKLNFDEDDPDVDLNLGCVMSKNNDIKCDAILDNFVVNSIADLHSVFYDLNQIDARLKVSSSFIVREKKLQDFSFMISANEGNFHYKNILPNKIYFSDFVINGKYNNNSGELSLSKARAYISGNQKSLLNKASAPLLQAEINVLDIRDWQNHKIDFAIKLQNTPIDELENLWPLDLNQSDIRQWVITHIKGGNVQDAFVNFSLQKKGENIDLLDINSWVKFSGTNLDYDSFFPDIKKIDGVANFNKKGMKISLSSGDVLNSKISEGLVEIEDFSDPKTILKISGKSQGSASDSLKHADHKSADFAAGVEKYLNGNSQNEFEIYLPIGSQLGLKEAYVAVKSKISGLKNDYLKGDVEIDCKKNFASNDFATKINLTATEVNFADFDIEKKSGLDSALSFAVSVENDKKILIKNISLTKKEGKINSKISGKIEVETSPFNFAKVQIKNDNFGRNNYDLSYSLDSKNVQQKIVVKGKRLNLTPIIKNKFYLKSANSQNLPKIDILAAVNNVELNRKKSLKSLYLFLSCKKSFCGNLVLKANSGDKQILNISSKSSEAKAVAIEGKIGDIGYLAEAFGFSNTISGGNAKIKLLSSVDGNSNKIQGSIIVDEDITFYENAAVKRLAKNDLFSKVKDKIFSQDKTTFDTVKIDFAYQNGLVDLQSLVANNYKIGITAKGKIDLKSNSYQIKGMIVPGFIINNLFGIGKIPVLGSVVGILTGGDGGGLFGIRYEYTKNKGDKEAKFETSKVSSFVPTTIKNLFDLI